MSNVSVPVRFYVDLGGPDWLWHDQDPSLSTRRKCGINIFKDSLPSSIPVSDFDANDAIVQSKL